MWKAIHDDMAPGLELDVRELVALEEAARTIDGVRELEGELNDVEPGSIRHARILTAIGAHRRAVVWLLGRIDLGDEAEGSWTAASLQARRPARTR